MVVGLLVVIALTLWGIVKHLENEAAERRWHRQLKDDPDFADDLSYWKYERQQELKRAKEPTAAEKDLEEMHKRMAQYKLEKARKES